MASEDNLETAESLHEQLQSNEINSEDDDGSTLQAILDKEVLREMKKAENNVTKQTINLRVHRKIAKLLNVDTNLNIDPKSIVIHPNNVLLIDEKWKKHIQNNYQISHDELNAYDKIKSTDYVKLPDLVKFLAILIRKDIVDRDPNDKEKIIKSQDLNILLGIDGFSGYQPSDIKNYIEHLKMGENVHVETIRKMYSLDLINSLSGTDATCLVFLALLSVYTRFITDKEALHIIDTVEKDIRTYLSKNAKYYKEINQCLEKLDELIIFYTDNVSEEEISSQYASKIADLISKTKKRKAPISYGKRGRKKLKIATEGDQEILKKRPRNIKPSEENENKEEPEEKKEAPEENED